MEDVESSPLFIEARTEWARRGVAPGITSVVAVPLSLSTHTRGVFVLRATQEEPPLDAEAVEVAREVVAGLGLPLAHTVVYSRVAYQHALTLGQGVLEYEPAGKAAAEIRELYAELGLPT